MPLVSKKEKVQPLPSKDTISPWVEGSCPSLPLSLAKHNTLDDEVLMHFYVVRVGTGEGSTFRSYEQWGIYSCAGRDTRSCGDRRVEKVFRTRLVS
jgi:hypothetical protein